MTPLPVSDPKEKWSCTRCTFLNGKDYRRCELCNVRNPAAASARVKPVLVRTASARNSYGTESKPSADPARSANPSTTGANGKLDGGGGPRRKAMSGIAMTNSKKTKRNPLVTGARPVRDSAASASCKTADIRNGRMARAPETHRPQSYSGERDGEHLMAMLQTGRVSPSSHQLSRAHGNSNDMNVLVTTVTGDPRTSPLSDEELDVGVPHTISTMEKALQFPAVDLHSTEAASPPPAQAPLAHSTTITATPTYQQFLQQPTDDSHSKKAMAMRAALVRSIARKVRERCWMDVAVDWSPEDWVDRDERATESGSVVGTSSAVAGNPYGDSAASVGTGEPTEGDSAKYSYRFPLPDPPRPRYVKAGVYWREGPRGPGQKTCRQAEAEEGEGSEATEEGLSYSTLLGAADGVRNGSLASRGNGPGCAGPSGSTTGSTIRVREHKAGHAADTAKARGEAGRKAQQASPPATSEDDFGSEFAPTGSSSEGGTTEGERLESPFHVRGELCPVTAMDVVGEEEEDTKPGAGTGDLCTGGVPSSSNVICTSWLGGTGRTTDEVGAGPGAGPGAGAGTEAGAGPGKEAGDGGGYAAQPTAVRGGDRSRSASPGGVRGNLADKAQDMGLAEIRRRYKAMWNDMGKKQRRKVPAVPIRLPFPIAPPLGWLNEITNGKGAWAGAGTAAEEAG
ncbi:unnamed protein product, partial [Discosporangium mesarthrocarpum]